MSLNVCCSRVRVPVPHRRLSDRWFTGWDLGRRRTHLLSSCPCRLTKLSEDCFQLAPPLAFDSMGLYPMRQRLQQLLLKFQGPAFRLIRCTSWHAGRSGREPLRQRRWSDRAPGRSGSAVRRARLRALSVWGRGLPVPRRRRHRSPAGGWRPRGERGTEYGTRR